MPSRFTRFTASVAIAVALLAPVLTRATPVAALGLSDNTTSPFWVTTAQGDVWNFGSAGDFGDLKGVALNKPIVSMAPTPSSNGYWLTATDGGIFAFGDAAFFGSTGNIRLNKPIVGMTPTPTGKGYLMTASDGGIFAYGDARFFGSTGSIKLNQPIVGMTPTPSNNGYWLVASDGGIFAFGDAGFYGSTGSIKLNKSIVAMASTKTGKGYWLVASDGGIFAFGDAAFYGSAGGGDDNSYQRIVTTTDGKGYWLVRNGGDVVAFGNANNYATRPAVGLMFQTNTPGEKAVAYSMAQLGKPYVWGGNGNPGYDCSGLTSQAWKSAGTVIPRVANDQYDFGAKVTMDQLRAGDLLYWSPNKSDKRAIDHVGMYIGGGWGVNAGGTGTGVNVRNIVKTSGWMMDLGTRPHS